MKKNLLHLATVIGLMTLSNNGSAQAPTLGSSAGFALFTTVGAVTQTGISQITGNVGSNSGSSTGFGNVNGVMNNNNAASAACATDLLIAYNQLNALIPTMFPAPLLGNGQILAAAIYSIQGASTLNDTLRLNANGNANAVFVFMISGTFASAANAVVLLTNNAQACNVFWKIEGAVSLAAGTKMKGTIIANNAAITISSGASLEGRALSTTGAVGVSNALVYTPVGCGSPYLTGPSTPTLNSTACYGVFSSNGPVTNTGISFINGGDVGTNVGLTTGFNPLNVTGMIHPIPDGSTGACASDLLTVYNYLNTLPYDIELLYPAQFGNKLVLTPHTYQMNGACTFVDTLFLNGMGNANAVFVISLNGALSTGAYAAVILTNGTQAKNVFWKVDGAVSLNNYTDFKGTIVANNGAINLTTGVKLNGRALTTNGAIGTAAIEVTVTAGCTAFAPNITTQPSNQTLCSPGTATFVVSSTGSGLTYQWRKGNVNLINGGNISGATTASLTISPATVSDSSSFYNVVVSGAYSPADTSNFISLTMNSSANITSADYHLLSCIGDQMQITVTTAGSGLSYQWRRGNVNLINAGNVSGVNTASLTFNPIALADGDFNYNVIVSGLCGLNDTSVYSSIVVYSPASISDQPVDQKTCIGGVTNFSVTALGGGLNYQWRKGTTNLINGGNISGATSATLTLNPTSGADLSNNYNVVITGSCSPVLTSSMAKLAECTDVGISNNEINTDAITVYPNPFSTELNLIMPTALENNTYELNIFNLQGAIVSTATIDQINTTLNTSELATGMYIYKISSKSQIIKSGKLISQ